VYFTFEQVKNDKQIVIDHRLANVIVSSHAVFNFLTAIQNQITFDQKRDAINGLSAYAKFLRKVLSLPNLEEWAVSEEAELLESYLKMEKTRFTSQIDATVRTNEASTNSKIPVLACLPFIELLVSSALKNASKPVKLDSTFKFENKRVALDVKINRHLEAFALLERNTEQSKRFELFKEKCSLHNIELLEKHTASSTNFTLIFNP